MVAFRRRIPDTRFVSSRQHESGHPPTGEPISSAAYYDPDADLDRNGIINGTDSTLAGTTWATALARGVLSSSAVDNATGYDGYRYNAETMQYTVRHRWYDPVLGRWLQRDPAGYVDSLSPFEYVRSSPHALTDPTGQWVPVVQLASRLGISIIASIAGNAVTSASAEEYLESSSWGRIHGIALLATASDQFRISKMGIADRGGDVTEPCANPGEYRAGLSVRHAVGAWAYSKLKWDVEWSSPNGCDIEAIIMSAKWSKNTHDDSRLYSMVVGIESVTIQPWNGANLGITGPCRTTDGKDECCLKPVCVKIQVPTALLLRGLLWNTLWYEYPSFTICANGSYYATGK